MIFVFLFLSSSVALGPLVPPLDAVVALTEQQLLCPDASWPDMVDSCWRARDRDDCLLLFYEEMIVNVEETIARVAQFLGVTLTEKELTKIDERCSFSWMSAHHELFDYGSITPFANKGLLLRRGAATNGDELTFAQRQRIDNAMLKRLAALGSDFPYRERYMNYPLDFENKEKLKIEKLIFG